MTPFQKDGSRLIASGTKLMLVNGRRHRVLSLVDIKYLESDHVYVRLYLSGNASILHRGSLRELLETLPRDMFLRIHRSFVVNIGHVSKVVRGALFCGKKKLPVSRQRADLVTDLLS